MSSDMPLKNLVIAVSAPNPSAKALPKLYLSLVVTKLDAPFTLRTTNSPTPEKSLPIPPPAYTAAVAKSLLSCRTFFAPVRRCTSILRVSKCFCASSAGISPACTACITCSDARCRLATSESIHALAVSRLISRKPFSLISFSPANFCALNKS